ncbi:hypothetical protein P5705_15705 [Pseudomonas entomophila]|uniref:hypothetical protein n=1 Tax=Pseudomonas entomophila TaxID=312306 RepID=UPI0024052491|nr:hypothetical protein [Pseudomonas entomophila]MDF9619092.1 hypothetical protein [Pseudomonas entomophila]
MRSENEAFVLRRKDVINLLQEAEFIVVSLENLSQHYEASGEKSYATCNEYCTELTGFIDAENVTARLASMRSLISRLFDDTLGDDDMSDLERALEPVIVWERPGFCETAMPSSFERWQSRQLVLGSAEMAPANPKLQRKTGLVLAYHEALAVHEVLEFLLISLRNIGLYYYVRDEVTPEDELAYRVETAKFVETSQMVCRLSEIRRMLCDRFALVFGGGELEKARRKLSAQRFWSEADIGTWDERIKAKFASQPCED